MPFFVFVIFAERRAVSSVGLEHYLDRVGVTGSNPVQPTLKVKTLHLCKVFFMAVVDIWSTLFGFLSKIWKPFFIICLITSNFSLNMLPNASLICELF